LLRECLLRLRGEQVDVLFGEELARELRRFCRERLNERAPLSGNVGLRYRPAERLKATYNPLLVKRPSALFWGEGALLGGKAGFHDRGRFWTGHRVYDMHYFLSAPVVYF
jgi:hypothetical protein